MKLLGFSIYDEKAQVFNNPFFTPAIGIASRMFSDLANDRATSIGLHPEDYKLYHIGYFNNEQASFDTCEVPIFIGAATDYLENQNPASTINNIKKAFKNA